jgi:hypothetical protein
MQTPFLSEFDPETKSEGSLDPLGTYSLADKLATKLIPGFRERMRRPRFLTAMAVGAVITREYEPEMLAADEISPPYQVYEWYVVQALVRKYKGTDKIVNLPGSEKATNAFNHNLPLNASRYLKTASVFGFHGVYRTLAAELDIIEEERLGEGGDRLVRAWEKDQNLPGFYEGSKGEGVNFKNLLSWAVKEAMNKGEVTRGWNWPHINAIAEHLNPSEIGVQEGKVLYELITLNKTGFRNIVIPALVDYLKQNPGQNNVDEGRFFEHLLQISSGELIQLLQSIIAYEAFCRTLSNGFEEILYTLSQKNQATPVTELLELTAITEGTLLVSNQYSEALVSFTDISDQHNFQNQFSDFEQITTAQDFVEALLLHHHKVQHHKPPDGKLDWVLETTNGKWLIRSNYLRRNSLVQPEGTFVHFYRMNPLRTFLIDLKKL